VKLQHRLVVPAPRDRVWAQFVDIPAVAACVPGAEGVVPSGEGHYHGRLRVGVGPVRLSLEGDLEQVSRDDDAGRLVLRGTGADGRLGGGVRAVVELSVVATGPDSTEVVIDSDVQVLGRIGELGQPIMRRKADEVMRSFAACLGKRLA
jgi:carbon monoxide dehydrogenase subunit G